MSDNKTHSSSGFDLQPVLDQPISELEPEDYDAAYRAIQRASAAQSWTADERRRVMQALSFTPTEKIRLPRPSKRAISERKTA